jgi:hypothetical protein
MPDDKHYWRGFLILLVATIIGTYLAEQLPPLKVVGTGLWSPVRATLNWLAAPALVPRGLLVLSVLLTWIVAGYFNKRTMRAPVVAPKAAPARFEPEAFQMTPLRSRALLALLGRVGAHTTLYDLHEATSEYDYEGHHYVDTSQSTGRIQHDMDDAERLGIVSIERLPNGTSHYYALTAQGRDWVLVNEALLKPMAVVDMTAKPRVRYT